MVGLFPRPTVQGLGFEAKKGDPLIANAEARNGEHALVSAWCGSTPSTSPTSSCSRTADGRACLRRVDTLPLYPSKGSELRRLDTVATVTSGRRRVRLILASVPFGYRSPEHEEADLAAF